MYDLYINDRYVGIGLSLDKLNEWLIDLDSELGQQESQVFRSQLKITGDNFINGDNFNRFLIKNSPTSILLNKIGG